MPKTAEKPPRITYIERIETWTGPAFILMIDGQLEEEIPEAKRQTCPQCERPTWAAGRWCHRCKFDLRKANTTKLHPVKLIAVALLCVITILLSLILVMLEKHLGLEQESEPVRSAYKQEVSWNGEPGWKQGLG